jgi:phosphoglycolate phosphatase-like HAD superfamily hydrolase
MKDLKGVFEAARAFVFDFDGTLVDSNPLKLQAFGTLFAKFPMHLPGIMEYCRERLDLVRYDKFRHIYESIIGLPYTAEIEAALDREFTALTTGAVIEAIEIEGASAFLKTVHARRPTAVLSSTPTAVLEEILIRRSWKELFDHVAGAPVDKRLWLTEFAERSKYRPPEIVYFGDTPADSQAASEAGCTFVGVGGMLSSRKQSYHVRNFNDLR